MKSIIFFILLLIGILSAQQKIDEVAAVIDDEIILVSEIEQALMSYAYQNKIDIRKNPEFMESQRSNFLKMMIDQKIMLVKAKHDTLVVNEDRVQEAADRQYENILGQVGSEQKLAQMYKMPISRIKRFIQKNIREQMLIEMVKSDMSKNIKVSRREVTDFYYANIDSFPLLPETVEVSHIVKTVKPSENAISEAKAKSDSLYQRIKAGDDFSLLAQEFSEDPGSGKNGGDLGFTERGQFVKPFEDVAYSMQEGEVSEPVLSDFGYHIIQLLEKQGERIHTRHILIMVQPTEDDVERTKESLSEIKSEIEAGTISFIDAALKYSEDPNVNSDKGSLGIFETDKISIPEFKAVVGIMETGEISDPFSTRFGMHILNLVNRRPARKMNLDDDYERIHGFVLRNKQEEKFSELIGQLREEIPISILID